MSDFNFEDFIAGVTVTLPREDVPLYGVVHQARIDEIDEEIAQANDPERVSADERESSAGTSALTKERAALVKAQDASARMVEIRCLTAQEWVDVVQSDKTDVMDQIAAQTQGTRNEMSREDVERLRSVLTPSAWALFVSRANQIVQQQLVMPDFSPSASQTTRGS